MAIYEILVLDGLTLTGDPNGTLVVESLGVDPPKQRQQWISTADSEGSVLVGQPQHENREILLRVRVAQQASMNAALDQVGALVEKLRKASARPDGIEMTWSPADSTRTVTFDVQAGEIEGMPVTWSGDDFGWFQRRPVLVVKLTCEPYMRHAEVTISTASSSSPVVTQELANIPGDIPALGRLIVTDTATQNRRHVEWGYEGPLTYNASTSLLIDSDSLVTSGYAGTGGTATGAYDPNGTGNSIIRAWAPYYATVAVCGTGNQSHVGTFRVKARVALDDGTGNLGAISPNYASKLKARLAWQVGGGPFSTNGWAPVRWPSTFEEVDLGTITIPKVLTGTQQWLGRIEATGGLYLAVDYIVLIPQERYGKARSVYNYNPGVLGGADGLGDMVGSPLNGVTADLGGNWSTSGATTDFVGVQYGQPHPLASDLSITGGAINAFAAVRSTAVAETGPRFGILGSTSYTNVEVTCNVGVDVNTGGNQTWQGKYSYVIARWTNSSNYAFLRYRHDSLALELGHVIGGVQTIVKSSYARLNPTGGWGKLRLLIYATGRAFGIYERGGTALTTLDAGVVSAFATGGTIASGTAGIADQSTDTVGSVPRAYINFSASALPAEDLVVYSGRNMQVRYDDTIRQDSSGTYAGRPPSYRGGRFLLEPGTGRVLVKANRQDVDTGPAPNVTDATQIQVAYQARSLVVPRT